MDKRTELIEKMRAGRAELDSALQQMSDDQMLLTILPGNWSTKDLLAHFGWWAKRAANLYGYLSRSETVPDENIELDNLNARVYTENQNRSLADVRRLDREAYEALLALASTAPEDDLFKSDRFVWTEGGPFVTWIINNTYAHYAEHLGDVKAWLEANK